MRPEISNNNSGKSSCAFSNLMQTTILNILDVVTMMRITCASFMKFLIKVDKSIKKNFSPWRKQKGCHDNDTGNSIEIPMQRRSMRMRAKDGGASPDSGCPTIWRQGNE